MESVLAGVTGARRAHSGPGGWQAALEARERLFEARKAVEVCHLLCARRGRRRV
jgi:hypothetical protein